MCPPGRAFESRRKRAVPTKRGARRQRCGHFALLFPGKYHASLPIQVFAHVCSTPDRPCISGALPTAGGLSVRGTRSTRTNTPLYDTSIQIFAGTVLSSVYYNKGDAYGNGRDYCEQRIVVAKDNRKYGGRDLLLTLLRLPTKIGV